MFLIFSDLFNFPNFVKEKNSLEPNTGELSRPKRCRPVSENRKQIHNHSRKSILPFPNYHLSDKRFSLTKKGQPGIRKIEGAYWAVGSEKPISCLIISRCLHDKKATYMLHEIQQMKDLRAEVKFLVTCELARLARYLRMLGFDTKSAESCGLVELQNTCQAENRILITRINKQVIPRIVSQVKIRSDHYREQIKTVIRDTGLHHFCLFSRCLRCNCLVVPVPKQEIDALLPDKVRQGQQYFTRCPKCGKIFWKGTHALAMMQFAKELTVELGMEKKMGFTLTEYP